MPQMGFGPGAFRLRLDPNDKVSLVTEPIGKRDRFRKDFEMLDKIGEGEFGIAHKARVISSIDDNVGSLRAIKQQKERYEGMRDRDLRIQEVIRAF